MPEIFSDGFQTSLAAAITSTARPVTFTVAAGSAQLSTGNFSVLIYDAGTDANPVNAERIQVTSVAGTSWTGTTETSDTAKTHVNGSTVRQILTARSIQQQMVDHTNTTTTPDPHNQYIRKNVITALGDLIVGTAVGLARLAKGTDGYVLTADSTVVPSGLAWKAAGASALTTIGDLLYFASAGAVRLPIGKFKQKLSVTQNAAILTDPVAAPTVANTVSPPANTWATSTAYLIAFSFANAYGETLLSATVTYNSGVTPVSQDVTTTAAPVGTTNLYVYVGLTAGSMHRTNTLPSPSTSSANVVTVTGPNLPGVVPQVTNTTGGLVPSWIPETTKEAVRAASTANVTVTAPGSTLDGVGLVLGDRILLKNQTAQSENGIYIWNGTSSTITRSSDASAAADLVYGFQVFVREGAVNAATYWSFTQTAFITLGTTNLTFTQLAFLASPQEISAPDFKATGLTGAVAASRYAGGTASGSPTTGTWTVGDAVVDQSGKLWICTVAGTPGTWDQANRVVSGGIDGQSLAIASATELTTIAAAVTTTTTIQIPANAIVLAVSVRVTVVIPTAATFTVIGNTSTTAFNTAAVNTAANSTDPGTAAGAFFNATAQTVRITPNLTPAANTGRVRVTIFYVLSTPPTS